MSTDIDKSPSYKPMNETTRNDLLIYPSFLTQYPRPGYDLKSDWFKVKNYLNM